MCLAGCESPPVNKWQGAFRRPLRINKIRTLFRVRSTQALPERCSRLVPPGEGEKILFLPPPGGGGKSRRRRRPLTGSGRPRPVRETSGTASLSERALRTALAPSFRREAPRDGCESPPASFGRSLRRGARSQVGRVLAAVGVGCL